MWSGVFRPAWHRLSAFILCLSGLMTSEELRHLEDLPSPHNKFWVPCMWFVSLALRARTEGRINNDVALTAILTVGLHVLSVCRPKEREHFHFVAIPALKDFFFLMVLPVLLFFFSVQELNSLRAKCMKLYGYDWISLPLVYTQVFFTYCAGTGI